MVSCLFYNNINISDIHINLILLINQSVIVLSILSKFHISQEHEIRFQSQQFIYKHSFYTFFFISVSGAECI